MGDHNSAQQFCCTCLKPCLTKDELISLNVIPAKGISYKFKLKCCVPEMVLDKYDDSYLCKSCLTALNTAYTFRCMCLSTEGKLAEFRKNCKKTASTNVVGSVKIKQEIIDPLAGDQDVLFMGVNNSIEIRPSIKKELAGHRFGSQNGTISLKQTSQNQLASLRFNKFGPEVELLLVDNSKTKTNTSSSQPVSLEKLSGLLVNKEPVTTQAIVVDKQKARTDLEIIQFACKTIPELLAYKCDVASLDCRVSLERVNVPGNTIKLPSTKYPKKKYYKKNKNKYNSNTDSNYWCHICVKFVAVGRRHRYIAHMLNHKNIKSYKCNKCPKEFTYAETLSKHKKECTASSSLQDTIQVLSPIHIKTENNININIDNKSYAKIKIKKERYDVDNDWEVEAKARKYIKVEKSPDTESRRSLRVKPVNKQVFNSNSDAFHCEICEYQSYKKHQYQVHMMKHFNDRRFVCSNCPKRFFENWELNRHLRTVHQLHTVNKRPPPNSYDIHNITPLIARQTNISEHTDDTNDSDSAAFAKMLEPSVSLTVNNETLVTPVIQSIQSLAGDSPPKGPQMFPCIPCNVSFGSHSLLLSHRQKHKLKLTQTVTSNSECKLQIKPDPDDDLLQTNDDSLLLPKKKKKKKFFCTICDMEFASKDHANIHTGAKPYDCKVCGKDFAAYSTLRKHRWTHLEEPKDNLDDDDYAEGPQRVKYTCDICKKVFLNKWQINSHTCHSSTGESVYRCQICKNAFVGRTALIEHMGMHVNQSGDFYQ